VIRRKRSRLLIVPTTHPFMRSPGALISLLARRDHTPIPLGGDFSRKSRSPQPVVSMFLPVNCALISSFPLMESPFHFYSKPFMLYEQGPRVEISLSRVHPPSSISSTPAVALTPLFPNYRKDLFKSFFPLEIPLKVPDGLFLLAMQFGLFVFGGQESSACPAVLKAHRRAIPHSPLCREEKGLVPLRFVKVPFPPQPSPPPLCC